MSNVYYVAADTYVSGDVDFLRDESGFAKINSIILPKNPDVVSATSDPKSAGYVGPKVCSECHEDYFDTFIHTSHFKTSMEPLRENILGEFDSDEGRLETMSPSLMFEMVSKDDKYIQRMLFHDGQELHGSEFEFGLVTGSGKVGQTYLYWDRDLLYQMHVSYLKSADSWANSPGYRDGTADFARPIPALCLDCHSTYFQAVPNTINQFRRDNYVLGVTCEKCHGAGSEHVAFHRDHPDSSDAHAIINPGGLSSELAMDVCQACHGGAPESMLQPAFSFRPGESLTEYFTFSDQHQSSGIHSNSQLPRLKQSLCFQKSDSMTCTDCHNPHQFERGDMKLFSDRCLSCHEPEHCGKFDVLGERLGENCIDCHMPSRELQDIQLMSQGEIVSPLMRDHFIKAYPAESEAYLKSLDAQ